MCPSTSVAAAGPTQKERARTGRARGKSALLLTVLDGCVKRQVAQELEAEVAKQVDDCVSRFELLVDSLERKGAADEGRFEIIY